MEHEIRVVEPMSLRRTQKIAQVQKSTRNLSTLETPQFASSSLIALNLALQP